MKVSKEEVAGLIAALERYRTVNATNYWRGWREMAEELAERLRTIPRVEVRVLDRDYAGDPSAIVQLVFDEKLLGRTAEQITKALDAGNPSIQLRDPQPGLLELDVRELSERYLPLIVSRLNAELAAGSAEAMRA